MLKLKSINKGIILEKLSSIMKTILIKTVRKRYLRKKLSMEKGFLSMDCLIIIRIRMEMIWIIKMVSLIRKFIKDNGKMIRSKE